MTAYILGAGSTLGTLSGLSAPPTSSGFGASFAGRSDPDFELLAHVGSHLRRPLAELGLDEIWSTLDYYSKLQRALPLQKPWDGESYVIKRALLRLYGASCDSEADRDLEWHRCTLGDTVVNGLRENDIVISFNYDTLFERLAKRLSPHPVRMVCSSHVPGAVWLAKPHGSTAWRFDPLRRSIVWHEADGSPMTKSIGDAELNSSCEPFVLGAVPIKSELLEEIQGPHVHEIVMRQWRSVVAALRDTDELVVLGYSFPAEDHYGRFLFREGILLRASGRPLTVKYYERPERAAVTASAITSALGHQGLTVSYAGPVTPVLTA